MTPGEPCKDGYLLCYMIILKNEEEFVCYSLGVHSIGGKYIINHIHEKIT